MMVSHPARCSVSDAGFRNRLMFRPPETVLSLWHILQVVPRTGWTVASKVAARTDDWAYRRSAATGRDVLRNILYVFYVLAEKITQSYRLAGKTLLWTYVIATAVLIDFKEALRRLNSGLCLR